MEETNKVQGYLDAYLKAIKHAKEAKSVREIDAAKLEGHKAYIDLSHQVNRITPEFARLCRERRTELTLAHYQEIENRTPDFAPASTEVEPPIPVAESAVAKKPAKKAKKAKK